MTLRDPVTRKIVLARHLVSLARDSFKVDNQVHGATGLLLLQDALESYLIAILDHLGISEFNRKKREAMSFPDYLDALEQTVFGILPLKDRMLEINGQRRNVKHRGALPSVDDCRHLLGSAEDFLETTSTSLLGKSFFSISLLALLPDRESKTMLVEAERSLESADFENCLISCRKAMRAVDS